MSKEIATGSSSENAGRFPRARRLIRNNPGLLSAQVMLAASALKGVTSQEPGQANTSDTGLPTPSSAVDHPDVDEAIPEDFFLVPNPGSQHEEVRGTAVVAQEFDLIVEQHVGQDGDNHYNYRADVVTDETDLASYDRSSGNVYMHHVTTTRDKDGVYRFTFGPAFVADGDA